MKNIRPYSFIIPFLVLIVSQSLYADWFYTEDEFREWRDQELALSLSLKRTHEQYINEKLELKSEIQRLESEVAGYKDDLDFLRKQKREAADSYEAQIANLKDKISSLQTSLDHLKKEKAENERLAMIQNENLEKELETLKKNSSDREQSLLAEKQASEKKLLQEIQDLKKSLEDERKQSSKTLETTVSSLQATINGLNKRVSDLETELDTMRRENENLSSENEKLQKLSEEQKRSLEDLSAQARELEQKLEVEIERGGIRLKRYQDRLVINMDNKILFDSGSATLRSPSIETTLDKIAEILAQYPENKIQIEGHTDDVPIHTAEFGSNWELSAARSLSVLSRLLKNTKLRPQNFYLVGAGEFHPIVPNNSGSNRALNRRVDIVVLPKTPEPEALKEN